MNALRILPPAPFCCCMPWRLRGEGIFHGARCCFCDLEIAAPEEARGKHVACIYCGLDRGFIPAVEIEPASEGFPVSWPLQIQR